MGMFVGDMFMSLCVVPLSPSMCEGLHGTLWAVGRLVTAWSRAGDVLELRARTSSDVALLGLYLAVPPGTTGCPRSHWAGTRASADKRWAVN